MATDEGVYITGLLFLLCNRGSRSAQRHEYEQTTSGVAHMRPLANEHGPGQISNNTLARMESASWK